MPPTNLTKYSHITLAAPTTTLVKSGQGYLHLISVNGGAATGVITVYDGLTASGTVIAIITQPAVPLNTFLLDVTFQTGLTIVTSVAAQDLTISFL